MLAAHSPHKYTPDSVQTQTQNEHSYDYSATTTNDYYDDYGMSNGC